MVENNVLEHKQFALHRNNDFEKAAKTIAISGKILKSPEFFLTFLILSKFP